MLDQDVLLDLLARKDNRAYQYLYQCYYVALKALANYYVKDNDVAEDLVQDVFISLLESDYKFKTEPTPAQAAHIHFRGLRYKTGPW